VRSLLIVSGFTSPIITLTMKIVKYATNESLNYDFNTLMSLGFVTIPSDTLTKILSSHNLPKPAYILEYGGNKGSLRGIKKL